MRNRLFWVNFHIQFWHHQLPNDDAAEAGGATGTNDGDDDDDNLNLVECTTTHQLTSSNTLALPHRLCRISLRPLPFFETKRCICRFET